MIQNSKNEPFSTQISHKYFVHIFQCISVFYWYYFFSNEIICLVLYVHNLIYSFQHLSDKCDSHILTDERITPNVLSNLLIKIYFQTESNYLITRILGLWGI